MVAAALPKEQGRSDDSSLLDTPLHQHHSHESDTVNRRATCRDSEPSLDPTDLVGKTRKEIKRIERAHNYNLSRVRGSDEIRERDLPTPSVVSTRRIPIRSIDRHSDAMGKRVPWSADLGGRGISAYRTR